MRPSFSLSSLCRVSVLALVAGAFAAALSAQTTERTVSPQLMASLSTDHVSLANAAGVSYSSSSSLDLPAGVENSDHLDLRAEGLQPPPRRRYGRPRYNDSSHNPDGSNKYTFVLGAGFTGPIGNTFHYLNTSYAIQVGVGRNFNKKFGVLAQFDYDRFGFNGRTLGNELQLENLYYNCTFYNDCLATLDGSSHVWSFSLDPVYNFWSGDSWGAYGVAGVGFFHKVANFTTPQNGVEYSPYYGYVSVTQQATIDHYTSNAPGFDGGLGLTYKPSRFAGERLFAEARYVLVMDSQRKGLTAANYNTPYGQTYSGTDLYPANSNRTTYLVYKFGIRF